MSPKNLRVRGARGKPEVDHRWLADLISRHQSNRYYEVATRFAQNRGMAAIDLLRVQQLLRQKLEQTKKKLGAIEHYLKTKGAK